MLKKVKLNQLQPNPHRNFETYSIQKDKVTALEESIDSTGFWGETIIARQIKKGTKTIVQIAFGHHRLEAARNALGPRAEVQISIRKLDDDEMFKMMARENNEVYAATADMHMELVGSALKGYADGVLHLEASTARSGRGKGRLNGIKPEDYGFIGKPNSGFPITRESLEEYTNLDRHPVTSALANLKTVNVKKTASKKDYRGLNHEQAKSLTKEVEKVEKKHGKKTAKKVAKKLGKDLRSRKHYNMATGTQPNRKAAKETTKAVLKSEGIEQDLPDIDDVAAAVCTTLANVFNKGDLSEKLNELAQHKEHMNAHQKKQVLAGLRGLIRDAEKFENKFSGTSKRHLASVK